MYGLGNIKNSLYKTLTGSQSVNGLGFVPMKSASGNAFELEYVPVEKITTDEKNFQNRADKFSEKSVNAIIKAVKNGSFNWFAFDPVLLWKNPDGVLVVLSGHSRTEAFRRLAAERPQIVIDGLSFDKIPAKIFKGDFLNAKNLALNSNALSTPETLLERADFYRRQRELLNNKSDIAKLREKAVRENQGSVIWDLSFLPADGLTVDSLKRFKMQEDSEAAFENYIRALNIAQWIGKAFQIYKGLSRLHDSELFKFLTNNYGTKSGQYNSFTKLNDRLQILYPRNVVNDKKVDFNGNYTTPFGLVIYEKNDDEINEIQNLESEAKKAKRELDKKIKDLRGRTSDKAQIFEVITPHFNEYVNRLFEWWTELDKEKTRKEDKNQKSLFGLGAVQRKKRQELTRSLFDDLAEKEKEFNYLRTSERDGVQLKMQLSAIVQKIDDLNNKVQSLFASNFFYYPAFLKKEGLTDNNKILSDSFYNTPILFFAKINEEGNLKEYVIEFDTPDDFNRFGKHIFGDNDLFDIELPSKEELSFAKKINALKNNNGLGKPTIKLEFEDNAQLLNFKKSIAQNAIPELYFDGGEFKNLHGLTVNDKPAALFNCPESMLQCKGFTPSYIRLEDYSSLIEPATGEKKLVGYGFEVATLNELANACNHYNDVGRLASHLKADNVLQSAFNVWHWLHTNIKYNYDTPGEEEIRTPARSWADRENGVDCDCIAVFTACLLGAMGYKPKFEIVAFNNSPKFSHIYVNLDGAAIDRVLPVFLARPENITKTKIMDIPVFELSGTADGGFSTLNGIYADTLLKVNSGTANAQDSMDLRKTQVLLGLQKSDPQAYKLAAILMPYVVAIDDNGSYYFANEKVAEIAENADKKLYSLKISGANQAAFDEFFNSIVGEMKNISVRLERGEGKTIVTISFSNPQNDTYNVEGEYVKKDMLAINPDFLTMRNALKNLIAVNYYDLATRFAVGLMTEVNAVQAGYTPETWQKAVEATNKLKKLWTLLGGDIETLIQVIESGSEKEAVVEVDGDTSIIETSAFDSVLHGCKYNALSGINGLGETSTVNSELDTLGEGFETLLEWVAEIEPGETVNISITKTSDGESNIRYASTMQDSESKNKALLWLLGGAVVGSGIAAATSGKNNKKSKR